MRPKTPPKRKEIEPEGMMLFAISNHVGQHQFWHLQCGERESPMNLIDRKECGQTKFKCVSCGRVGSVTIKQITKGKGLLKEE